MKPTYHIVSHSHWDREWYKSFEQFRAMLVNMVDDLLDLLKREREFHTFTLDGQTIVIEDYLDVRPERHEELRRMIAGGRIVTGPWYVLPDEFLVSAEATVRNLLVGTRAARALGGTMNVGYIPDSFGHIAMMPAILKGFGIETALVYRGFGGEPGQTTSEYWWTSPDGSRVLLLHLFRHGYSAGYFHQESDKQILERFAGLKAELDARATTSHRMLMNGGDHHWPDPTLPATLALLRGNFDARFEHSTVQRYAEAVRREVKEIPEVQGELRFGYRHAFAVLGGVSSSRIYLKQANWKMQNLLQRYAEPLNAFASACGMRSQMPLLHRAWKTLLQNHPHDSICGCSIDSVHREMMTRFKAVDEIGGSITGFCFDHLVPEDDRATKDDRALFFFNPSPFPRTDIVEAELKFYLQDIVVGLNPDVTVAPPRAPVKGFALVDAGGNDVPSQILRRSQGYDITYSRYNYPAQTYADTFSLLVDVRDLPPVGIAGLRVERRSAFPRFNDRVRSGKNYLENDYLRVEANARGEVTVKDKVNGNTFKGLNAFEDTGDVGDEYNYSYPKKDLRVTSRSGKARVTRIEKGPLRASLRVGHAMRVPAAALPDRSSRSIRKVTLAVTTTVSLTPYSRAVEFETRVDNRADDHRFRVLFPSGVRTDRVNVDSQFCIIEREQKEYDVRRFTIEHPAKVAPMQRHVTVKGNGRALTLFSYGMPEYELLRDGEGTIALTLLRCVGLLAGDDLITRPGGKAGWHNETPEAQCPGVHTFRYALFPHRPEDYAPELLAENERFHLPVIPIRRKSEQALPPPSSFVSVAGDGLTLSALKEAEDGKGVVLRVYNPFPLPVEGVIRFGRPVKQVKEVRLDEENIGTPPLRVDGGTDVSVSLAGGGIITIKVQLEG